MLAGALGAALLTIVGLLPGAASADVNSDKAQVAQLASRIAHDGAVVQSLVASYDQAQATEAAVETQLDATRAHLAADKQTQARATVLLRKIAVESYMDSGDVSPILDVFDSGAMSSAAITQEYTQVATQGIDNAIDTVSLDALRTQATESKLRTTEAAAAADVQELASSRQAAQAALTRDDTLLSQAQGDLQASIAAAARQRQAAEEAEEEAMAARAAQAAQAARAAQAAGSSPVDVVINPSPGSYANPIRAINALSPERIDQGVDYSGYGPIYAIGDGVVLSTVNGGWPGGTFISYRLSDGPASGLAVYAAEDIDPAVAVGQSVTVNTVLGTMYEGPDGIETGWADPSGDGVSMAHDFGQFSGANSTAFGANFSQLLESLGAPPGVPQNYPPTGSLPPSWPTW
jgi:murein DD-endopeptidase MepM/ murein hydrolase activator NlpD